MNALFITGLGVAALIGLIVLRVFTGAASSLVNAEARGQLDAVCRELVEKSVCVLPLAHRDRYRDEWEADLAQCSDTPITALILALRIRRDANRLAVELGGVEVRRVRNVEYYVDRAVPIVLGLCVTVGLVLFAVYGGREPRSAIQEFLLCFGGGVLLPGGFYGLLAYRWLAERSARLIGQARALLGRRSKVASGAGTRS